MSQTLAHRGPDRSAVWVDSGAGVGLGHERLAILDLSPAGDQPMHSASGRFVIAFNGEIYNHHELRRLLAAFGHRFRGTSDTEVLLAGFEQWGVAETLKRCVGMFAFSVWDAESRRLTLARDRAGEKPLYYGWHGSTFLCGSELKALRAHPEFRAEIDRGALTLYLRFNYIPSPHSIFAGIRKLPPGTCVSVRPDAPGVCTEPEAYWSLRAAISAGVDDRFRDEHAAADALDALLRQSVREQTIADVPIGAFLSGGIDSSLIVAVMQSESGVPVKTFTIGYAESAYDETPYSRAVARHIGTEHTELRVTADDALSVIPHLPSMYDEPFADSSQIPTHLVCRLARKHVTVALSGDGADELFGGYERYSVGPRLWRSMTLVPGALRTLLADSTRLLRPAFLDRIDAFAAQLRARPLGRSRSRERIVKLAELLRAADSQAVYDALGRVWPRAEEVVVGGHELPTMMNGFEFTTPLSLEERMMCLDFLTYLPDDILVKVDRAAMATSLETRAPFLDFRIIEFAYRLPIEARLRRGQRKRILRTLLSRYVPDNLIDRPKMGFAIPLGAWLRGPLRDWAENLLDEGNMRAGGYFVPSAIRGVWEQHLAGRVDASAALWGVLMFEAWRNAAET